MRKRSRVRVLEFVAQHPGASTSQIARGLGISTAAVRHHLRVLRADDRIGAALLRPVGRRGRPELGYRTSERLLGSNLPMLIHSLLSAWSNSSGTGTEEDVADVLARALAEEIGSTEAGGTPGARMTALVERLGNLHYRAHWEAGAEGPRLMFGHCPYSAVILDHPELCRMDALAVSKILAAQAKQVAQIDVRGRGGSQCVFELRWSKPDTEFGPPQGGGSWQ